MAAPLALAALACRALAPGASPTLTPPPPVTVIVTSALPGTEAAPATLTAEASASQTPSTAAPSATPGADQTPDPAGPHFIAYVRGGHLQVTDITGGVQGGTTQYTLEGVDDQVVDLAWSPSGEFIAFTSVASGDQRLFVVYAVGAGTPVDLGPGALPAWSPDSTRLAFQRSEGVGSANIWLTEIESPNPRQLTTQEAWAWGRPAFHPDGNSVIVAGAPFANMGAQGNTEFYFYSLGLEGAGSLTPLPGLATTLPGRLPYDLAFSPDGSLMAFSTNFHISACASSATYHTARPDGSELIGLISPSLQPLLAEGGEVYHFGYSFAWLPGSDGLILNGLVVDCGDLANAGQVVLAEQQMSQVSLEAEERAVVVGNYDSISADRAGRFVAAALRSEDFSQAVVHVFNLDGELVLDLGEGDLPELQP